jgi:hypothetical protein
VIFFAIRAFFVVAFETFFTYFVMPSMNVVKYCMCLITIYATTALFTVSVVFAETIIANIFFTVTNVMLFITMIFVATLAVANAVSAVVFAIDIKCFVFVNFTPTVCAVPAVASTTIDVL